MDAVHQKVLGDHEFDARYRQAREEEVEDQLFEAKPVPGETEGGERRETHREGHGARCDGGAVQQEAAKVDAVPRLHVVPASSGAKAISTKLPEPISLTGWKDSEIM